MVRAMHLLRLCYGETFDLLRNYELVFCHLTVGVDKLVQVLFKCTRHNLTPCQWFPTSGRDPKRDRGGLS